MWDVVYDDYSPWMLVVSNLLGLSADIDAYLLRQVLSIRTTLANNIWPFTQTLMGVTISYSFSVSCAKLSILFFYLRLSPDRNFRISVYVLVALTTAYTVIYNIVIFLLCDPPDKAWFPAKDGHCTSQMGPM